MSPDNGVRRWALNCAAILGFGPDYSPILDQLDLAKDDPDLLAAVVAALFAQVPADASRLLTTKGVDIEGAYLIAAARYSPEERRRLIETKIPINTASDAELKAGLILTGTGVAPEHLFFTSHKNKVALEQLNLHPTASVSKYSIWALAKLRLGFGSLQIPISEFDSSPPEVRKWVLRLLFSDPKSLRLNLELVQRAARDTSDEVRHESAIELRDVLVDGLPSYVTEWFFAEPFIPARDALIEHMAANAYRVNDYWELITTLYEREPFGSQLRTRMEAAAAGTKLYANLRFISARGELPSLLPDGQIWGGPPVTQNITQNFGNAQIGAVSGAGDIRADSIAAVQGMAADDVRRLLERALSLIAKLPDESGQAEGNLLVQEAAREPKKSNYQRLIGFFKRAKEGVEATSGLADSLDGLVHDLGDLAGL